jgi:hypothetical protein
MVETEATIEAVARALTGRQKATINGDNATPFTSLAGQPFRQLRVRCVELWPTVAALLIPRQYSVNLTDLQLTMIADSSDTLPAAPTLYAIALLTKLRNLTLRIDRDNEQVSIEAVDGETSALLPLTGLKVIRRLDEWGMLVGNAELLTLPQGIPDMVGLSVDDSNR